MKKPTYPVKNIELVIKAVGNWNPLDIAYIKEVHFIGDNELANGAIISELALGVLLQPRNDLAKGWPNLSSDFWEVDILFQGVTQLHLEQWGNGKIQVMGFNIEDHTDSQLENLKIKICDYENEVISFWAYSAIIISCKNIGLYRTKRFPHETMYG
jgi:hypothetical protein